MQRKRKEKGILRTQYVITEGLAQKMNGFANF